MLTWSKRFLIGLNVLACLCCIGLGVIFVVLPVLANLIYEEQYKEKMFVCDKAMRNHLIEKNRVKFLKSREALKRLERAEIALVHCHDYDLLRKRMLSMGLSANDLALIGLKAIEEKSADIDKLVEIHEFKY